MNEFFPKVIKKRDGKVAPFNIERIKNAIYKAAYTLGGRDEEKAVEVANEVARGRDPDRAIDSWIRRIASEIVEKQPREATKPKVMRTPRRLADVLPEIR